MNGLFLFCDHYSEPDMPSKDSNLYLTRDELPIALFDANFMGIECLLDKGGMALYAATKGSLIGRGILLQSISHVYGP